MEYVGAIGAASSAKRASTRAAYSQTAYAVSKMLYKKGLLSGFAISGNSTAHLQIGLKYTPHGQPLIRVLQPISKPSKKVWINASQMQRLLSKEVPADYILRTSKGYLWASYAVQRRLGGELLLKVSS